MALTGEYVANPSSWVQDQVDEYTQSGGTRANTLMDTGIPVILVSQRLRKSGKWSRFALMRVEHDGEYALIASRGGAPEHPAWYKNLLAAPTDCEIQDGATPFPVVVREVHGEERELWWDRSVAVFPNYAEYAVNAAKSGRTIPVLVAKRA